MSGSAVLFQIHMQDSQYLQRRAFQRLKPQTPLLFIFFCSLHIYEFWQARFSLTKIKGRNIKKNLKQQQKNPRYFKQDEELAIRLLP